MEINIKNNIFTRVPKIDAMKKNISIILSLLLLISCTKNEIPKDYTEQNEQEIISYLEENNLTAIKDEYGIYYVIEEEGNGDKPINTNIVKINFEGSYTNEEVFASSDEKSAYFSLEKLITGLAYGIPHFNKGGSGKIILPSSLAFNDGSVVVFDIELQDFFANYIDANDDEIVDYLADKNLTATKTDSGLYYLVEDEGVGENPTNTDNVTVAYKGYYTNESVFDESTVSGIAFNLDEVIEGWTEGIPYFKEGGSGKLFIPSTLGYDDGLVRVFDVRLISIN